MPERRPQGRIQSKARRKPHPLRERRGNLVPIEGWLEPLRCPQCGAETIDRVDLVEAVRPVAGARRPWGVVQLGSGPARVDLAAIAEQLYRCRECESEWPVEPGTRFLVS